MQRQKGLIVMHRHPQPPCLRRYKHFILCQSLGVTTRERFIQTVKKVLVSMRKTISYFVRKMELMQKLTTMSWMADRIRCKNKGKKKEYTRLYFRYESMEEIEEKLREGQVLT